MVAFRPEHSARLVEDAGSAHKPGVCMCGAASVMARTYMYVQVRQVHPVVASTCSWCMRETEHGRNPSSRQNFIFHPSSSSQFTSALTSSGVENWHCRGLIGLNITSFLLSKNLPVILGLRTVWEEKKWQCKSRCPWQSKLIHWYLYVYRPQRPHVDLSVISV